MKWERSRPWLPAQYLEKATDEDTKIAALTGELAGIEQKKADRQRNLAELDAKQAKAKADLEDQLKRNDESRTDAVNLTDYQKKELSEVEARQATIIQQFNADTEQITKTLSDLRARREAEAGKANAWNAEDARIDNAYKAKLTIYQNAKAQYDKDEAAYESANFFKRQLLKKPFDPGVPPVREDNTILKPTLITELERPPDQMPRKRNCQAVTMKSAAPVSPRWTPMPAPCARNMTTAPPANGKKSITSAKRS